MRWLHLRGSIGLGAFFRDHFAAHFYRLVAANIVRSVLLMNDLLWGSLTLGLHRTEVLKGVRSNIENATLINGSFLCERCIADIK